MGGVNAAVVGPVGLGSFMVAARRGWLDARGWEHRGGSPVPVSGVKIANGELTRSDAEALARFRDGLPIAACYYSTFGCGRIAQNRRTSAARTPIVRVSSRRPPLRMASERSDDGWPRSGRTIASRFLPSKSIARTSSS
mgnify:CR=1 FL=1